MPSTASMRPWHAPAWLACALAMAWPALPLRAADATALPTWSVDDRLGDRYVAAHGLRALAGGYAADGLEVWAFPLQLVSGYRLAFAGEGIAPVDGLAALQRAEVDPLGFTRHYRGDGFTVRERFEARGDLPGVRARFTVEGPRAAALRIEARFEPSLNLMWPVGIGGQESQWDAAARGYVFKEPSHRFAGVVASPQAVAHVPTHNDRRGSRFDRTMAITLAPERCGDAHCARLAFAGRSEAAEDAQATARALLDAPDAPLAADVARHDRDDLLAIETPDADANRALLWSRIALEQAWSCNPRLGCGLLAGYGPSHGSRRPQYAWFFGGDGLVSTRALVAQGDLARAAASMDFILRHQHPGNGMLWHEMSQSAGFVDWAGDYEFMYVHVDIAFQFLATLAEYTRATGDRAFLESHWAKVLAAWRFCLSTIDAGDGLPRVPDGMMSGNEQDRLTDELTLSAGWVAAADAMAGFAGTMGDAPLAAQARAAADRARAAIRPRYRDAAAQRWISGFKRSGEAGESFSYADLAAIGSGAATPAETAATFDALASPAYLTAWGLRSKPSTARDYDPEAYSAGSVWGLGTGAAAEAMWRHGRARQAADLWRRLVPWAAQDAPGRMHEVQSGERFLPQRESVPAQTWSSAAFLSAAVHGLLGIEVDAHAGLLRFAPRPPDDWRTLRARNVRVGPRRVDLAWRRDGGEAVLEIRNPGAPFRIDWREAPLAGDGDGATLAREVPTGETRLVLPLR